MALQLLENQVAYSKPASIDVEGGWLRGVKFCGIESANGRRYPKELLAANLSKYENRPVYFAHGKDERHFHEQAGQTRNPVLKDDGVYGDVKCLVKDPYVPKFLEAARDMSDTIGMSHSASGDGKMEGDTLVVTELNEVFSVDIVTSPATTRGLFESKLREGSQVKTVKLKKLLENAEGRFKGNRAKWAKWLREEAMPDSPAMAADVPEGADKSPEEMLKAGFRGAIMAILDDDTLDLAAKVGQIKDILKTEEKMLAKPEPEAPADDGGGDGGGDTKTESRRTQADANLQERLDRVERKERLLDFAAGLNYVPPKDVLADLLDLKEDAAKRAIKREAARESAAGGKAGGGAGPRSAGPASLTESKLNGTGQDGAAKDAKALAESMFSA